jgi:hypothetical protein
MISMRAAFGTLTLTVLLSLSSTAKAQPVAPERGFTILIFETPKDLAKRSSARESVSYWEAYNQFAGALAEAGVLRGGSALSETSAITTRGSGSADAAVSGARLGGYVVIEATSLAEAQRFAAMAPAFAVTVEVRPHRENPTMTKMPDRE